LLSSVAVGAVRSLEVGFGLWEGGVVAVGDMKCMKKTATVRDRDGFFSFQD